MRRQHKEQRQNILLSPKKARYDLDELFKKEIEKHTQEAESSHYERQRKIEQEGIARDRSRAARESDQEAAKRHEARAKAEGDPAEMIRNNLDNERWQMEHSKC